MVVSLASFSVPHRLAAAIPTSKDGTFYQLFILE